MHTRKAALYSLYCASAIHGMIHTLSLFLSPLNVEIGTYFQSTSVGAITSFKTVYLIVYAASNLLFGALTHRIPVRETLSAGMLLNAAAVTLFYLVPPNGIPLMYLLWILAALSGGVYHPVANVFITRKFQKRKGWALGITGIGSGIGFAFGPLLTGFLSRLGLDWQSIAALFGFFGVGIGILSYLVIRDDGQDEETVAFEGGSIQPQGITRGRTNGSTQIQALQVGRPLDQHAAVANDTRIPAGLTLPLLGFLAWMILFTATREIAMWSILDISAFFLDVTSRNPGSASFYLFVMYLPGIVTQPLMGHWSDRLGRRGLVFLTFSVFGGALVVLPFVSIRWLFLLYVLMGAAQSASVPLVEAIIADYTTPQNRGMMFGVFITAIMGLGALGPFLSGVLVDGMGKTPGAFQVLFGILGTSVLLGGIGLWITPRVVKIGGGVSST